MSSIRPILIGTLSALSVLVLAAILVPLYSDYLTRSQSSTWVAELRPTTMAAIAEAAMRLGTVRGSGEGIPAPGLRAPAPVHVEVTADGAIILHGGRDGQLMVWTPHLAEDAVEWRCRGGSARDVPSQCQAHAER